jgi:bifunctional DNA-binding transcriptional regulator/antitoxin component of YhaV-PrlF toxin-antitoxin module
MTLVKTGKRGTLVLPNNLRKRFQIEDGSMFSVEEKDGGIFLKTVSIIPTLQYSPEEKAEFLLSNCVTQKEFEEAKKEVKKIGVDINTLSYFSPWK